MASAGPLVAILAETKFEIKFCLAKKYGEKILADCFFILKLTNEDSFKR